MVQGYDVPGLMVEEGMADIVRMDCMERSCPSLCAPSWWQTAITPESKASPLDDLVLADLGRDAPLLYWRASSRSFSVSKSAFS
jgi:hypothetical protein